MILASWGTAMKMIHEKHEKKICVICGICGSLFFIRLRVRLHIIIK
jgi:hypothetical protein